MGECANYYVRMFWYILNSNLSVTVDLCFDWPACLELMKSIILAGDKVTILLPTVSQQDCLVDRVVTDL